MVKTEPSELDRLHVYDTLMIFLRTGVSLVNVPFLFLTVPWVGMQCLIVVYPDHNILLFVSMWYQYRLFVIFPFRVFIVFFLSNR